MGQSVPDERTFNVRTVFRAELRQVGDDLVEIATLVRRALERAGASLLEADVQVAEEVISDDARIDLLQTQLDERSIDLLALQGPVASDLRMIVGALRMSASLERMGDLARHLAQVTRLRYPDPAVPESIADTFRRMVELDTQIIDAVIDLLQTRDLEKADAIYRAKGEINGLHESVFAQATSAAWSGEAQTIIDVTLLSRYLERFGDHGVSVARKVTYLVTGEWDAPTSAGEVGREG